MTTVKGQLEIPTWIKEMMMAENAQMPATPWEYHSPKRTILTQSPLLTSSIRPNSSPAHELVHSFNTATHKKVLAWICRSVTWDYWFWLLISACSKQGRPGGAILGHSLLNITERPFSVRATNTPEARQDPIQFVFPIQISYSACLLKIRDCCYWHIVMYSSLMRTVSMSTGNNRCVSASMSLP